MRTTVFYSMFVILFCGCLGLAAPQDNPDENSVAVTVYNDNFAVVKERRPIVFNTGLNTIRFTDVASSIEPASVSFQSVSAPGQISVIEQNYEYDLVSADKILGRYTDRPVGLLTSDSGTINGNLLSFDANRMVLAVPGQENPIQIVSRTDYVQRILLPELPGGLITKPTLNWLVDADRNGEQTVEVTYQTGGMSWRADYSLLLAPDEKSLDLSAWIRAEPPIPRRA